MHPGKWTQRLILAIVIRVYPRLAMLPVLYPAVQWQRDVLGLLLGAFLTWMQVESACSSVLGHVDFAIFDQMVCVIRFGLGLSHQRVRGVARRFGRFKNIVLQEVRRRMRLHFEAEVHQSLLRNIAFRGDWGVVFPLSHFGELTTLGSYLVIHWESGVQVFAAVRPPLDWRANLQHWTIHLLLD